MAINTEIPISKVTLDDQEIRLEEPNLVTKEITENGTYNATDDNADGYSSVVVNIASSGGSGGEEVKIESYNSTHLSDAGDRLIELALAGKLLGVDLHMRSTIMPSASKGRATLDVSAGTITLSDTYYSLTGGYTYRLTPTSVMKDQTPNRIFFATSLQGTHYIIEVVGNNGGWSVRRNEFYPSGDKIYMDNTNVYAGVSKNYASSYDFDILYFE